jgi:hypothetical protein
MDKEHLPKVYIVLKCHLINKMKNKKSILEVRIVPKSNRKFVERGKIDTPNTYIHDCSLSWSRTDTSIKSGGVKLDLLAQTHKVGHTYVRTNSMIAHLVISFQQNQKWRD